jgi:valyl-tRNA synthetase
VGSIHKAEWPSAEEVLATGGGSEDPRGVEALNFAAAVLSAIRKKKSEEQRPLKTAAALARVQAPASMLGLLPEVERDLRAAGLIQELETAEADTLTVQVELTPPESSV